MNLVSEENNRTKHERKGMNTTIGYPRLKMQSRRKSAATALIVAGSLFAVCGSALADDTESLAKDAQNPVANLISVPFQNNFNFNVGPEDVTQYILNIEPVIPITLNRDWNVITRTIVPIINQPSPAPGVSGAFGLGDINPTFFLSPARPCRGIFWGLGPTFTIPTATASILGSGKLSAGPAAVALVTPGHMVAGALLNQQWSIAGWGSRSVSEFLIQPFFNYNLRDGWYVVGSPIVTADWKASGGNQWTVPMGGGIGKIQHVGKLPINFQLQAFDNVVTPNQGANWQLRFQIQLLFPK
jgi:hypothetical protein